MTTPNNEPLSEGEVIIAIDIDWEERDIMHIEIIDALPNPDSVKAGDWGNCFFYRAFINGGDSEEHYPNP